MPDRAVKQGPAAADSSRGKRAPEVERKTEVPQQLPAEWIPGAAEPREAMGDPEGRPSDTKTARRRMAPRQVLALQRAVGNRAVGDILRRSVAQRVAVSTSTSETLYNKEDATTGEATAGHYGGMKTYDITRQGDTGATVLVKIKFLNQARNTVPPPDPNPTGLPRLGALMGSPTEIPASDPRRAWATTMAQTAVAAWNGRLTLTGEETNVFSANTKKRLPVTFRAEAIFGIGDEAHNTVIAHGPATTGGAQGHPIDAGNWYMNKNNAVYPAQDSIIYAHEYGHLIGIPDEYSQSNEQMNALLHQAAPGGAASAMAALDKATIERMALAAMKAPLMSQLSAAMPTMVQSIVAQGDLVKQKMATAARGGVRNPGVAEQLKNRLVAESTAKLSPSVPTAVAFQTTKNFSNITRASEGVQAAFDPARLGRLITQLYERAVDAPLGKTVTVAGLGEVSINPSTAVLGTTSVVPGTTGAGYNAGNAGSAATQSIGPSAPAPGATGPGGAALLPTIPPPDSLVGKITALPAAWAAAGSALESAITPDAFATKLQAILPTAQQAILADLSAMLGGAAAPPKMERTRALYERAYALINNAAVEAATQLATELVNAQVQPVVQTSINDLQTTIANEAKSVSTMSPTQLAAAANPNPGMRAIVADMKRRLDIDKKRTEGTGRNPLGAAGGTAPTQDVTYSYQGLMGSNATTAMRPDQFQPMVDQFNKNFKSIWEKPFKPEVK
jgi:hypothetical protein